jgi:hypothetical protein
MHIHPAKALHGPVSGARFWWRQRDNSRSPIRPKAEERPRAPKEDDDPTFRADLVARIRRQIAEGTYGTEEQLEKALEKLFDRLDRESPE